MKKAFTLIELLMVVAIMAFLGVASAGGYAALTRGIKERGAVAAASAFLRAAKERALIDRVPTAVFCYNKLLKDSSGSDDSHQVVVGEMVAVRRQGRISSIQGDFLFDEFADLNLTYDVAEDESELRDGSSLRLYKFAGGNMSDMRYSVVASTVWMETGRTLDFFSRPSEILPMCAFYNQGKSEREATWSVGSAYALEFGELQLPHGFVFSGQIPSRVGEISGLKVLCFDPENESDKTVEMISTRPDSGGRAVKFRDIGKATSDEKEGV